MRHALTLVFGASLALGAMGCNDFLSGKGIDEDPNNITQVDKPGPLYVGVQTAQAVQFEGQLGRSAAEYTQQVSGFSRQQIGFDLGTIGPADLDAYFSGVYASTNGSTGGGGLLDIRKIQELARAKNDSLYLGIAKVWEALVMGMAASIWGDIPYRQAVKADSYPTPAFDPQLQVYADALAQLDSAITVFLPATPGGNNIGPSQGEELIYAGRDPAGLQQAYTEVAHSLKARYYLHLSEVDPANYALALQEAQLGISSPANDMLFFHTADVGSQNIWWQFQDQRGDIGPGAAMINLMKARIAAGVEDSARLTFYFSEATDTLGNPEGFFGYRPGGDVVLPGGQGSPGGGYSDFTFINPNLTSGDFRQPLITYDETQLIAAEAAFQTGGQGAAQPFLDAARANRVYGATGGAPVVFPALPPVPATLENIMAEKYEVNFLNIEAWNDYKRTCLPPLAPPPPNSSSPTPGTVPIPGRLPYGLTEINTNPNTPSVSSTGRNPNDPTACPVLDYTSSNPVAF